MSNMNLNLFNDPELFRLLGSLPSDCSCKPTSKASLSFDELLDKHARYWIIVNILNVIRNISQEIPYRCYNAEEELHFHRAMFCDPNLNLFPEIFPIEANLFM